MKIILKKTAGNSYDISTLLSSFEWAGSIEQGVRSFSFSILNSPYDLELMDLIPNIEAGDIVSFYTDADYAIPNYLLFFGKVSEIERKSNKGVVTYKCLDFLNNLTKSSTYRTFNATAEAIAQSICSEFGLTVQYLAPTGVSIGNMVFEDKTYFEIINESYKKATLSTGIKYFMGMDGDKFYTQVEGYPLLTIKITDETDNDKGHGNIINSSYQESMNEIVNRVNVYDSEGNFQTRLEDAASIEKYGLYEKNYTIEKDVDVSTGAKEQLHDIEKTIVFDVLGDVNYWSGRSVEVNDKATGLKGIFLITNDIHKWSGGDYTTTLYLKKMGA